MRDERAREKKRRRDQDGGRPPAGAIHLLAEHFVHITVVGENAALHFDQPLSCWFVRTARRFDDLRHGQALSRLHLDRDGL